MRCKYLLIFVYIFLVQCTTKKHKDPHVIIETKWGDIEVELYPDKAPQSTAAFLKYVDSGFYKNSHFYRVLKVDNQPSNAGKAELIQGGMYKSNYKKSRSVPGIPHESTQLTGLRHTEGTLSFARQEPGTARTEFFITIGEQTGLDHGGTNNVDGEGYAAFGKVVKGMDIVHKIQRQPDYDQTFDPLVAIYDITRF